MFRSFTESWMCFVWVCYFLCIFHFVMDVSRCNYKLYLIMFSKLIGLPWTRGRGRQETTLIESLEHEPIPRQWHWKVFPLGVGIAIHGFNRVINSVNYTFLIKTSLWVRQPWPSNKIPLIKPESLYSFAYTAILLEQKIMTHRHCTIDGIGIYKNFLRNLEMVHALCKSSISFVTKFALAKWM